MAVARDVYTALASVVRARPRNFEHVPRLLNNCLRNFNIGALLRFKFFTPASWRHNFVAHHFWYVWVSSGFLIGTKWSLKIFTVATNFLGVVSCNSKLHIRGLREGPVQVSYLQPQTQCLSRDFSNKRTTIKIIE